MPASRPRGVFSPNTVIEDARQRWLFRMVHSPAPLQEKMTLFWHHHFATAYSKLNSVTGSSVDATRMMAAKPSEDPGGARGQIELFRDSALGNFRQLLVDVAKDIAMMYWLDGRLNTKALPQENFGRELMELFTFGVENYVETDVYAAAKVFSGWNIVRTGTSGTAGAYWAFNYNANQHDTGAKDVQLPDLRGRQPDDSGAFGRAGDAGRPRSHQCARYSSGNRAPAGAAAVDVVRERDRGAGAGLRRLDRERLSRQRHRDEAGDPGAVLLAALHRTRPRSTRATRGRSSSSSDRSRKSATSASASTTRGRRSSTWASSCSSRPTSTAGRSAPAGSRPAACWRA